MANFQEIADAAKNFACTLYKNQPGSLIPNPFSDALHHAWDSFCGDFPPSGNPGLPDPPVSDFSGGQCSCVGYRVNYRYSMSNTPTQEAGTFQEVWGPVEGIFVVYPTSTSFRIYVVCRGLTSLACGAVGTQVTLTSGGKLSNATVINLRIVGITRLDGTADSCGNIPPKYPVSPPPPVGGYTSPPVDITFNNNTSYKYVFNFKPPVAPSKPANSIPPIVINYANFSLKPDLNIPITFNFDGTVNFGIGGGGSGFGQPDRDKLDNINNNVNNVNDGVTNIDVDLKDLINVTNNQPVPPEDLKPPVTNLPPGEYEQEGLKTVYIELTQMPGNAKKQAGGDAPDVVYAGWFEWRQAGRTCPRQPIHFEQSAFVAPVGVDGFAYTLYNGFQGIATSVSYKEKQ